MGWVVGGGGCVGCCGCCWDVLIRSWKGMWVVLLVLEVLYLYLLVWVSVMLLRKSMLLFVLDVECLFRFGVLFFSWVWVCGWFL